MYQFCQTGTTIDREQESPGQLDVWIHTRNTSDSHDDTNYV